MRVTGTTGSNVEIEWIYPFGSATWKAHATVTADSIVGHVTSPWYDPSAFGAVNLTIHADGSLSGTIMIQIDAFMFDGWYCGPELGGYCVEINPRIGDRYRELSR